MAVFGQIDLGEMIAAAEKLLSYERPERAERKALDLISATGESEEALRQMAPEEVVRGFAKARYPDEIRSKDVRLALVELGLVPDDNYASNVVFKLLDGHFDLERTRKARYRCLPSTIEGDLPAGVALTPLNEPFSE